MADLKIENDNRAEVLNILEHSVKKALTAVGMEASSDIIKFMAKKPIVDTGLLKNSITFALSGEPAKSDSYKADNPKVINGELVVQSGRYTGNAPNDKIPAVYIGTNVEYGKYVQFGTSKMNARDFMFAPLRANMSKYKKKMEDNLK